MFGFLAVVLVIFFFVILNNRIESLRKELNDLREGTKIVPSGNLQSIKSVEKIEEGIPTQASSVNQSNTVFQSNGSNTNLTAGQERNVEQKINEPDALSKFIHWVSVDWPMKTGAFFLILALGWFVTYAFINDWIGPIGRVSLGLIFGAILLLVGAYVSRKLRTQGNVLSVVGAITVLITILAGMELYDFFNPLFALVVMFVVVVFLALIALYQKNKALAVVVLVLGSMVPLFVFEEAGEAMIMVYLFILSAGTIWLVRSTEWKVLTLIALLVVAFYSITFQLINGFDETWQNILFAFVFTGLFYLANMVAVIKDRIADKIDLIIAGIIGILFLLWMISIVPDSLEVFIILLGAVIFALSSFAIFKLTQLKQPVLIYAGVSLMLIVAATALQFEGSVLTAAYLLEAGIFAIVSLYLFRNQASKKSLYMWLVVLFAVPVIMSLENVARLLSVRSGSFGDEEIADLFILILVILISFIIAMTSRLFVNKDDEGDESASSQLANSLFGVTGAYLVIIIWSILHLAMSHDYFASMTSLIIYTIAGMIFYVKGKRDGHVAFRIVGGLLFGLVIARLLLVEFWQMDMVAKIITFFVIGALFVSTSFIKKDEEQLK